MFSLRILIERLKRGEGCTLADEASEKGFANEKSISKIRRSGVENLSANIRAILSENTTGSRNCIRSCHTYACQCSIRSRRLPQPAACFPLQNT